MEYSSRSSIELPIAHMLCQHPNLPLELVYAALLVSWEHTEKNPSWPMFILVQPELERVRQKLKQKILAEAFLLARNLEGIKF